VHLFPDHCADGGTDHTVSNSSAVDDSNANTIRSTNSVAHAVPNSNANCITHVDANGAPFKHPVGCTIRDADRSTDCGAIGGTDNNTYARADSTPVCITHTCTLRVALGAAEQRSVCSAIARPNIPADCGAVGNAVRFSNCGAICGTDSNTYARADSTPVCITHRCALRVALGGAEQRSVCSAIARPNIPADCGAVGNAVRFSNCGAIFVSNGVSDGGSFEQPDSLPHGWPNCHPHRATLCTPNWSANSFAVGVPDGYTHRCTDHLHLQWQRRQRVVCRPW
jgi:hypothetical protein